MCPNAQTHTDFTRSLLSQPALSNQRDLIYIKSPRPQAAKIVPSQHTTKSHRKISRCASRRNNMDSLPANTPVESRSRETRVFVFLTVVLAPMIAVAIVGSYGLLIWLYQMLMGPPRG